MRITKIISFLFLVALTASCSSSDSGGSSSGNSFTYNKSGSNVPITIIQAQMSESQIVVSGTASDGRSIQFEFDKFGNLGTVLQTPSDSSSEEWHYNYQNFSGHYFTFNMISYNESTHRVKVTYSGTLYEEAYNSTSPSIEVSGEFDVVCTVQTPIIPGLDVRCKIGGFNWYSTNSYTNNGNTSDDFILRELSDDENMISLGFDSTNNGPSTYNFTASTPTNFAHLSKFDTTTLDYVDYNCVGSVIVTSKTSLGIGLGYLIEGTYSFTATNPSNPSDQIQVTEGYFKTNYLW